MLNKKRRDFKEKGNTMEMAKLDANMERFKKQKEIKQK